VFVIPHHHDRINFVHLLGHEADLRRYWQTERLGWFADRAAREGLKSVGVVESRRRVQG